MQPNDTGAGKASTGQRSSTSLKPALETSPTPVGSIAHGPQRSTPAPSAAKAAASTTDPRTGLKLPPGADPPARVETCPPPELSAPKPAEWKTQPAIEDWCPPAIGAQYPELRNHHYQDNYAMERVLRNSWRVAGATRRGRLHAHQGTHREDAVGFTSGVNFTVLTVADGAGSSKLSRLGSQVAVNTVLGYLTHHLPLVKPPTGSPGKVDAVSGTVATPSAPIDAPTNELVAALRSLLSNAVIASCLALQELAVRANASPKDFRCTLLSVLHYQEERREWLLANQVGDGAICLLLKNKSIQRCCAADSGEFSGEVSCFVPDECAKSKALDIHLCSTVDQVDTVMLCSDGVEDPFYPMERRAVEIFRQLHSGVREKLPDFMYQATQGPILGPGPVGGGLAQWLGFEKRGENDDRSLLLLHRYPSAVGF